MFKPAKKVQTYVRAGFYGISGSGKTFSALGIATGLVAKTGGRIAVIDTERGSAAKYADRFEFDVAELENRKIENYLAAFKAAAAEGYSVLIVDSLSHAWQELLEEVDRANGYGGNKWSAWAKATPKQKSLVDALLSYPGHVLATMRVGTEWNIEEDDRGKKKPVRIGLKPEQGKGIEFEFDLLLELDPNHVAHVRKDRTGHLQDRAIETPGEEMGEWLARWTSEGLPRPEAKPAPKPAETAEIEAEPEPLETAEPEPEEKPKKKAKKKKAAKKAAKKAESDSEGDFPLPSAADPSGREEISTSEKPKRRANGASATAILLSFVDAVDGAASAEELSTVFEELEPTLGKLRHGRAHALCYHALREAELDGRREGWLAAADEDAHRMIESIEGLKANRADAAR